ncbi:hypothetical protein RBSWK_04670 [Rhodopirellula baltica SWK14]|uniref:Uncharacterized protein n=1 Tax=Rhodopirellula baltica SWK14 TaxID=993516 RepID=L7CC37_RHOBT|nr:hypothetical protein RBSWK_04670 [Rhodopirellula baltica SWK14]
MHQPSNVSKTSDKTPDAIRLFVPVKPATHGWNNFTPPSPTSVNGIDRCRVYHPNVAEGTIIDH